MLIKVKIRYLCSIFLVRNNAVSSQMSFPKKTLKCQISNHKGTKKTLLLFFSYTTKEQKPRWLSPRIVIAIAYCVFWSFSLISFIFFDSPTRKERLCFTFLSICQEMKTTVSGFEEQKFLKNFSLLKISSNFRKSISKSQLRF